jgi:TatD DNase family protein
MLVDSHAHLNFKAYQDDLSTVIDRCRQAEMKVINVGAAYSTSQKALVIAKDNPDMYVALGLHPIHVYDEEFKAGDYQKLIDDNKVKVVALGETGLDYFHLSESLQKGAGSIIEIKQKQTEIFQQFITIAQNNDLPLIIHGRNGQNEPTTYQDIYKILKKTEASRGVIHCFGGNLEEARQFIDLGFYLGFTGVITFDKTGVLEQIIKWLPEDRMLIETDSPYLTPEPYRGQRNEPIYVKYVATKIADLKNQPVEEIIELTGQNAYQLFNLK